MVAPSEMSPSSTDSSLTLSCRVCAVDISTAKTLPFACPNRDGEGDHALSLPAPNSQGEGSADTDDNPFIRFRSRLCLSRFANSRGMRDGGLVTLLRGLDSKIAAVDGRHFEVRPMLEAPTLAKAAGLRRGRVLVKNEAVGVADSHKARHLFGILAAIEVDEATLPTGERRRLAIASCGNAALAAAVLASATDRELEVFIPPTAPDTVVKRLRELDASIHICPRKGSELGDTTYRRFREAVADGAIPFCCQGPDNVWNLDGGSTLGCEIANELDTTDREVDSIFVQVGGGALAASCFSGFEITSPASRAPRLHAVQSAGAAPLARAWEKMIDLLFARIGTPPPPTNRERADLIHEAADRALIERTLVDAAGRRGEFMRPWETEPRSIAAGILDDETHDWVAVIRAMLLTGGWPLVVDEDELARAHELGSEVVESVCPTGTAGLAGLLALNGSEPTAPDETSIVLFTGARR